MFRDHLCISFELLSINLYEFIKQARGRTSVLCLCLSFFIALGSMSVSDRPIASSRSSPPASQLAAAWAATHWAITKPRKPKCSMPSAPASMVVPLTVPLPSQPR